MLIVGGGDSTASVLREIFNYSRNKYLPVAIVDDDREKIGREIMGVRVEGARLIKSRKFAKNLALKLFFFQLFQLAAKTEEESLIFAPKLTLK